MSHAPMMKEHSAQSLRPRVRAPFLQEFLRNPRTTASVTPSSRVLAESMIRDLDFSKMTSIVEYGPGSGPFTRVILERLPKGWHRSEGGKGTFIAIEFAPALSAVVQQQFPQVVVVNDSAEHVEKICAAHGIGPGTLDAVISGLGWVSFPKDLTTRTLEATQRMLRPGAEMRTFGYHMGLMLPGAWHLRSELKRLFRSARMQRGAWRNIPPAFLYRCVK